MGQAKQKMTIKVDMAKMAQERAEYRRSIPMRLVKGFLGVVLLIPLTMFAFGAQSFQQNKWPWRLQ
mgnify:CR=1 FL=1